MKKIDSKKFIGKEVNIVIDRALGTKHPKHGFVYTVNYGYVLNVISGDGEELDAYLYIRKLRFFDKNRIYVLTNVHFI